MKSQDILILLKLIVHGPNPWKYEDLATSLYLSKSTAYNSIKYLIFSGLYNKEKRKVNILATEEFIVHGLKYVFPPKIGHIVRGVPTLHSSIFFGDFLKNEKDSYVWPSVDANSKGFSVKPIYPTVPKIAKVDEKMYQLLTIVDTIRIGRARERKEALNLLDSFLKKYNNDK